MRKILTVVLMLTIAATLSACKSSSMPDFIQTKALPSTVVLEENAATTAAESVPTEAPRTEGTTQKEVTTVETEASEVPLTQPVTTIDPTAPVVNPRTDEDVPTSKPATVVTTLKPETPPEDFEFHTSEDLYTYLAEYVLLPGGIGTVGFSTTREPNVHIFLYGDDSSAVQAVLDSLPIDHSWYEIRTNAPRAVPK